MSKSLHLGLIEDIGVDSEDEAVWFAVCDPNNPYSDYRIAILDREAVSEHPGIITCRRCLKWILKNGKLVDGAKEAIQDILKGN